MLHCPSVHSVFWVRRWHPLLSACMSSVAMQVKLSLLLQLFTYLIKLWIEMTGANTECDCKKKKSTQNHRAGKCVPVHLSRLQGKWSKERGKNKSYLPWSSGDSRMFVICKILLYFVTPAWWGKAGQLLWWITLINTSLQCNLRQTSASSSLSPDTSNRNMAMLERGWIMNKESSFRLFIIKKIFLKICH